MAQVVFLNGPPRCGKDMLVQELTPYIKFTHLKAAAPLKRAAAAFLGMSVSDLEAHKDTQSTLLGGDSPRQMLISMSEDWAKVQYGKDFFGRCVAHEIRNLVGKLFIISDSGFIEEVNAIIKKMGERNCMLIRIHRDGCDFMHDSRSYLQPEGIVQYDLQNNETKHMATMLALRMIQKQFDTPLLRDPDWIK